jgi:hypothetical protein
MNKLSSGTKMIASGQHWLTFDYFRTRIFYTMNLQSFVYPLADAMQWTFRNLLEPMSHWFNWVCVVFCIVSIWYWLRRQKNYNQKAQREGSIS